MLQCNIPPLSFLKFLDIFNNLQKLSAVERGKDDSLLQTDATALLLRLQSLAKRTKDQALIWCQLATIREALCIHAKAVSMCSSRKGCLSYRTEWRCAFRWSELVMYPITRCGQIGRLGLCPFNNVNLTTTSTILLRNIQTILLTYIRTFQNRHLILEKRERKRRDLCSNHTFTHRQRGRIVG